MRQEVDYSEERQRGSGMKTALLLIVLVFVGVIAWQIGEKLSSDAISMGLGVLFGMLAGLPAALLVLAGGRGRNGGRQANAQSRSEMQSYQPPYGAQPPIIVLTGQGMAPPQQSSGYGTGQPSHAQPGWTPEHRPERHFKVVGETEEWIDEW